MLYYTFPEFMLAAIQRAEPRINETHVLQIGLTAIVCGLIEKGWSVFVATATLLTLGAFAFAAALAAFLISGVGVIVIAVLALVGFGAYEGMKFLYANKWFPLAILNVGKNVKPEFEACKYDDSAVSRLLDRTVEMLVSECR